MPKLNEVLTDTATEFNGFLDLLVADLDHIPEGAKNLTVTSNITKGEAVRFGIEIPKGYKLAVQLKKEDADDDCS